MQDDQKETVKKQKDLQNYYKETKNNYKDTHKTNEWISQITKNN